MTCLRTITLLVQDKQHLRKMRSLIPALPKDARIQILIDDVMCSVKPHFLDNETEKFYLLSRYIPQVAWTEKPGKNFIKFYYDFRNYLRYSKSLGFLKKPFKTFFKPLKFYLRKHFPTLYPIFSETYQYMTIGRWTSGEAAIRAYITANKPDLLILAEGNVQYMSEAFIKAFHKEGVPSVIAPYTFCTPEEPANYYKANPMFKAYNYQQADLGEQWFYTYQDTKLIRLPYFFATAYEKRGYAPPQPWVLESGSADRILVESEAMKRHYLSQNLPAQQLAVVGDVAHDRIREVMNGRDTFKQRFSQDHHFALGNARIIVFAVFPDLTQKLDTQSDFTSYHDSLAAILGAMDRLTGWKTILSLHPSLQAKDFQHHTSENIVISDWPAKDLVGLCDLYVASISATIRWAIAAGVPVINYDIYKLQYTDYKDVGGVVTVDNWADFKTVFEKATTDTAYLDQLTAAQRIHAPQWGILDGQFQPRLHALLEGLINTEKKEAA